MTGPRQGDFSRPPLGSLSRYRGVLMQQGRVQLDSDWNAQADLFDAHLRQTARDLIGPSGGPETQAGFGIRALSGLHFTGGAQTVRIDAGALPVDPPSGFAVVLTFEPDPAAAGTLLTLAGGDGSKLLGVAIDAAGSLTIGGPTAQPMPTTPGRTNTLTITATGSQVRLSLGDASVTAPVTIQAATLVLWLGAAPATQAFSGWVYDLSLYGDSAVPAGTWSFHQRHGGPGEQFPPQAMPDFGAGNPTARPQEALRDLTISAGRYYVDGVVCSLPAAERFSAQADLPGAAFDPGPDGQVQILYLDVSERLVTEIQDPDIGEVALGDADTTVRTRTVAQVRCLPIGVVPLEAGGVAPLEAGGVVPRVAAAGGPLEAAGGGPLEAGGDTAGEAARAALVNATHQAWRGFLHAAAQHGRLRVRRGAIGSAATLDNLLYRVEIHTPAGQQPATFKWSRMNGSVVYPLRGTAAPDVLLLGAVRPDRVMLRPGDWVEVLDDQAVVLASAGPLRQVMSCDTDSGAVNLTQPLASTAFGGHPFLRRWDHRATVVPLIDGAVPVPVVPPLIDGAAPGPVVPPLTGGAAPGPDQGWIELEHGIEVRFEGGPWRTGDYWCLPARTALGTVIWPGAADAPDALPPEGITHRFARLATLRHDGTGLELHDDRRLFPGVGENDFVRDGGMVGGNVLVRGWLRARSVEAEHLSGMLETPGSVRREALAEHAVSLSKLARDVGVLPPGAMILTDQARAPHGFRPAALVLEAHPEHQQWAARGTHRPAWAHHAGGALLAGSAEHVRAVSAGEAVLLLAGDRHVLRYDPAAETFHHLPPLPEPVDDAALAAIGERLAVIGGCDPRGRPVRAVQVFDPAVDAWQRARDLPHALAGTGATRTEAGIAVAGGTRRWGPFRWASSRAWFYDPALDAWCKLPSLPARLTEPALAHRRGDIYVLGGRRHRWWRTSRPSGALFRLALDAMRWRPGAALDSPFRGTSAAIGEAWLYAAGTEDRRVQQLLLEHGEWTPLPPLPIALAGTALVTVNDALYAFGWHGASLSAFALPVRQLLHVQRWTGDHGR
jgi:hypothetical protein